MGYDDWANPPYAPAHTSTTQRSRLDFKRGRFSIDYETNEIHAGLRGKQAVSGDWVDWFRYQPDETVLDDIYDEVTDQGRSFIRFPDLPVLHVLVLEGSRADRSGGLYYVDNIHVTLSLDSFEKMGFTRADIEHQRYLTDRIGYNGKVFKVNKMDILGQIQRRDLIIAVDGEQVRNDELIGDAQFKEFSA